MRKKKIEGKLSKLEHTVVNKMNTNGSVVPHNTLDPAAKKQKH